MPQTYLYTVGNDPSTKRGFDFYQYMIQNFTLKIENSIDPYNLIDYPIVFNGDTKPEMNMAYFFFIDPPKKGDNPTNHKTQSNLWIYMLLVVVILVVLVVGIIMGVVIYRKKRQEEEEEEV